jgi:WD40 repeat protein
MHCWFLLFSLFIVPLCISVLFLGSAGSYSIWDLNLSDRCGPEHAVSMPVTAIKFSPDGKFLAYATGYDWETVSSSSCFIPSTAYSPDFSFRVPRPCLFRSVARNSFFMSYSRLNSLFQGNQLKNESVIPQTSFIQRFII